jgi:hypothetical protein
MLVKKHEVNKQGEEEGKRGGGGEEGEGERRRRMRRRKGVNRLRKLLWLAKKRNRHV